MSDSLGPSVEGQPNESEEPQRPWLRKAVAPVGAFVKWCWRPIARVARVLFESIAALLISRTTGRLYVGRVVVSGVLAAGLILTGGFWGWIPGDQGMPDRRTAIEDSLKLAAGVGAIAAALLSWEKMNIALAGHQHQVEDLALRERHAADDLAARRTEFEERVAQAALDHALAIAAQNEARFIGAVKMLGEADPLIRAGGLFALDELLKRTDDFRTAALDLLNGFLRAKRPAAIAHADDADYRAAITIALAIPSPWRSRMDLARHHLEGSVLSGDLEGFTFRNATLKNCSFSSAALKNADFTGADLQECGLLGATTFDACNFTGARFTHLYIDTDSDQKVAFTRCQLPAHHQSDGTFDLAELDQITWVR